MPHMKGASTVTRMTINELPHMEPAKFKKELTMFNREIRIMSTPAWKKHLEEKYRPKAPKGKKNKENRD